MQFQVRRPTTDGFQSLPKTFKGDRGGSAVDDDLLAELRAISAKSSSADRFQEDESGTNSADGLQYDDCASHVKPKIRKKKRPKKLKISGKTVVPCENIKTVSPTETKNSEGRRAGAILSSAERDREKTESPPPKWTTDRRTVGKVNSTPIDKKGISQDKRDAAADGDAARKEVGEGNSASIEISSGTRTKPEQLKSSLSQSSFSSKGSNQSGDEEDYEILAELQAIDIDASSMEEVGNGDCPTMEKSCETIAKTAASEDIDKFSQQDFTQSDNSDPPSEEDDELLAELQVIDADAARDAEFRFVLASKKLSVIKEIESSRSLEDDAESKETGDGDSSHVEIYNATKEKLKESKDEFTQKVLLRPRNSPKISPLQTKVIGDRSGPAEDADQEDETALSQPVSPRDKILNASSSSAQKRDNDGFHLKKQNEGKIDAVRLKPYDNGRVDVSPLAGVADFQGNVTENLNKPGDQDKTSKNLITSEIKKNLTSGLDSTDVAAEGEIKITTENFDDSLNSKQWKMRKAAYGKLKFWLSERINGKEGTNDLDGNAVFPSLDLIVVNIVKETNVSALDEALSFAVLYADCCKDASEAKHAANICASLLKGPALSSRPTSVKLAKGLVLKLMEVSRDRYCSIHSVVDVLLTDGLSSKKPKVVLNSIVLVLEAAQAFGAPTLPLETVSSNASRVLSHTNSVVRENGLKLVAELCRSMGSKDALENVISSMKPAQVSDLDVLLKEQEHPSPPSIGLRFQIKSTIGSSAPSAEMVATSEEEKVKKFASRIAVNITKEINQTDFAVKIKEIKWSQKVAALDILINCGGEKPYKFCQPAASIEYSPLIRNLKQLLSHTHFAVKSRALIALGMLAEGVGERLFSHIRPLLCNVFELLKDKKVIKDSFSCLDSFFGNVIGFDNLLEKEDAILSAVNGKAHPLVRKGALEFMKRCIERAGSAGPRGLINTSIAQSIAKICCAKLSDQDAGVRSESCNVLKILLKNDDSGIKAVTEHLVAVLGEKNHRAYKTLLQAMSDSPINGMPHSKKLSMPKANKVPPPTEKKVTPRISKKSPPLTSKAVTQIKKSQSTKGIGEFNVDMNEGSIPSIEDSHEFLSGLGIQNWDAAEDANGISSGLKSTTWMFRKKAIEGLASFLRSNEAREADPSCPNHVLVLIKSYTKNFKESNLNLVKALIEVFVAVCDLYFSAKRKLEVWISEAAITLAVGKISDKKLTKSASHLLTLLCEVQRPEVIVTLSIKAVRPLKSPLIHEGLLTWCKSYCDDFGVSTLQKCLPNFVSWALEEWGGTNVKVKSAASVLIREMHVQLGPSLKALIMSNSGLESSTSANIENLLALSPFDATSATVNRERTSFAEHDSNDGVDLPSVVVDIPKTDLVAALPTKCLTRMAAKEGKIAWKIRKEALDEVENVCLQNTCIWSTTPNCMKSLIELCKALKERLTDLQSNLKPLAARNIAHVLGSVDSVSQAKLARIVCGPLVYASMYDNKKLMRDASIAALEKCTNKIDIEGGGANPLAMKSFMTAVLSEIEDSDYKAIGLPSILDFATKKAEYFPHVESISSPKSKALERQFSAMTVACLTSSKTETRSAAESLLGKCTRCGTLSPQSIDKGVQKLTTAEQRNVQLILNSLGIDGTKKAHLHAPVSPHRLNSRKQSALHTIEKEKKSNRGEVNLHASANPLISSSSKHSASLRICVKEKKPIGGERSPAIGSTRRSGRDAHASSKRDSNFSHATLNDLVDDAHFFPLISNNGLTSTKAHRALIASKNRDPWPEYPEEPSSKELLKTLKQIWSPLLPSDSIGILFPSGGIVRQDDVCNGCALMTHALTVLQANGQEHVLIDQLDLVNKWLAFAICCRESTAGMQAILPFILELFSFLRQSQYQMTDSESGMLLPYLLEKSGVAKERFRDMLLNLLESLASDDIYPLVKYGSVTCISVIEMSDFPKARVLATRECYRCVENYGPKAIGKKGIQLVAKRLSNEKNSENRATYLDLIELIIQKMNGDIDKYFKVCGRSSLSGKSRGLVEERWLQHENASDTSKNLPSMAQSSATKKWPSKTQSSPTKPVNRIMDSHDLYENASDTSQSLATKKRPLTAQSSTTKPLHGNRHMLDFHKSASTSKLASASKANVLSHELPSLNLKVSKSKKSTDLSTSSSNDDRGGPFKFMFKKVEETFSHEAEANSSKNVTGLVAPLRERMRKISEKRRSEKVFNAIMCDVDDLLSQPTPLGDKESISSIAVTGIRRIHLSLTKRGTIQTNAGQISLEELRQNVKTNLPYCVARLTSVLGFGFRCGTAHKPDALHTPLFSVSIAGLMAILSDSTLSVMIPEEVLILVIRRAASGLLDRRLAGNLKESNHGEDISTVAKIAKAINKLAVQATLGVNRHVSLQSLLSLQLQICSASVQEGVAITDVSNIHNRMSRIITKLFLRVIQVAENEASPFSGKNMDLFSLLRSLEGFLQKARSVTGLNVSVPQSISRGVIDDVFVCDDRMVPLLTMGRNFMLHVLKSSQEKIKDIKDTIDYLRLAEVSLTRRLFNNCCDELGLDDIYGNSQNKAYDADQLSELIFAIGKAEEEEDRMYAFDDLREFLDKHKQVDIEHHLSTLSSPFRKYVLDELENPNPFRPPLHTDSLSILSGYSGESSHSLISRYSTSDAQMIRSTRSLLSVYSDDSSRSLLSGCNSDTDYGVSTNESMQEKVRKLIKNLQSERNSTV